ncbi:MAG: hypothetical protein OEY89_05410 [Gammaproteobacteria bacterium]|nr:hypothetical protein [Gammaproteobacteria bacterium]
MRCFNISLIVIGILSIVGCGGGDDDDSGSGSGLSVTATIDGMPYTFSGCGAITYNGYEYDISCTYIGAEAKRLILSKAYDVNGGAVRVLLTDIPDASLLDSPYGINYECDDQGSCLVNAPVFDAATTTITLTGVSVPQINNNTADYGAYIPGAAEHTISVSVDVSTIAPF